MCFGMVSSETKLNGPNASQINYLITKPSLKELNLYFNIMNVKLCLLNQEMSSVWALFLNVKSNTNQVDCSFRKFPIKPLQSLKFLLKRAEAKFPTVNPVLNLAIAHPDHSFWCFLKYKKTGLAVYTRPTTGLGQPVAGPGPVAKKGFLRNLKQLNWIPIKTKGFT